MRARFQACREESKGDKYYMNNNTLRRRSSSEVRGLLNPSPKAAEQLSTENESEIGPTHVGVDEHVRFTEHICHEHAATIQSRDHDSNKPQTHRLIGGTSGNRVVKR